MSVLALVCAPFKEVITTDQVAKMARKGRFSRRKFKSARSCLSLFVVRKRHGSKCGT